MSLLMLLLVQTEPKPPDKTVVVTATRSEQDAFNVPRAVVVAEQEHVHRRAPFSLLDSLKDSPGIWIEKRTLSTSDIVVRGLSGSNILALVDGNTLSTLWGEGGFAGDDMYGKVDADSIERIEVVRGPNTVLYGSNALGGVVNFIPKNCPFEFPIEGWKFGAYSKVMFGAPESALRIRQEGYAAGPDLRFIFGGSHGESNDVRAGGGRIQDPSSSRELNWDGRIEWKATDEDRIGAWIQVINRDHIHRFYRPTEDNWNDRTGVSLYWNHRETDLEVEAKAYYQTKVDRRVRKQVSETGTAVTNTYSADARATGRWHPDHRVTVGAQYHVDFGESPDDEQFTRFRPGWASRRKDAPDSVWHNGGLFVQDEWDVCSWLTATFSVRGDLFWFTSDPDSMYQPPGGLNPSFDKLDETHGAVAGGAGFLVRASENVHPYFSYARGYRLWPPKFGVTQQGYGVLVPTLGFLDPMAGDTFEVGCKVMTPDIQGEVVLYYTDFDSFQVIVPGTFLGSDWYDFDGDLVRDANESVYVIENAGRAFVWGAEIAVKARVYEGWSVRLGFAANQGEVRKTDQPLRHVQPMRTTVAILWEDPDPKRGLYVELAADFVDTFDDVPTDRLLNDPGFRTDPQNMASPLVRPFGLPGYVVIDFRAGINLFDNVRLAVALDNLTDARYRRAHSRWDEPGFNAMVSLSARY